MTITQLKTELREFIALSETITPGEWIRNYGHNSSITLTDYETDIAIVWSKREYHSQDATFIARSRNISPTMAKMLLVAVDSISKAQQTFRQISRLPEGWEGNAGANTKAEDGYDELSEGLQQILKLWEETK